MAQKVLRLLKTGGYSYCSSPEELVGKGRCNHIPGMCFHQKQVNGLTCVEVSSFDGSDKDLPEAIVDAEKLNAYVINLDNELSKEKKKKILNFFKNYKR